MIKTITTVLERIDSLVKITCCDRMRGEYKKAVLRRIEGGKLLSELYTENKVFHSSVEGAEIEKWLKTHVFECFKQTEILFVDSQMQVLTNKKGTVTVKNKKAQTVMDAVHNRKKNYILQEGEDIPAMKDLGIFTAENKVSSKMQDKFRQINRFIETVDDVFKNPPERLTVLDFGCGKSYLTFLLYYYLTVKRGIQTKVIGYDLKADVVERCNKIANRYGYDGLSFVHADVKKDKLYGQDIDMIITLHACDTATDYALDYAIRKNAKYIFSVPCCQHEINSQIREGGELDIMLKHGLIKERFSALLTDAVRVEVLENAGYRVDCLEFVGFDASPKNLMIRAVRTGCPTEDSLNTENLLKKYGVSQTLITLRKKADSELKQEAKNG